jgi:hypothetical protein
MAVWSILYVVDAWSFHLNYGPAIDSVSNINEYQDSCWEGGGV